MQRVVGKVQWAVFGWLGCTTYTEVTDFSFAPGDE